MPLARSQGLQVAPATVSLMVSDLSRSGILTRREDDADRRRAIVSITEEHHAAVDAWLSQGANAWRTVLQPALAGSASPSDRRRGTR